MNNNLEKLSQEHATDMMDFINKGISPFHVVEESRQRLLSAGFTQLYELDNWNLQKGGKYFYIRSNSTLIAFVVGKTFNASNSGFKVIGAHTDSPCIRLAPVSKKESLSFRQTCVTTYGGGLWHTWFDRDLKLGGRVVYKEGNTLKTTLYSSEGPILKVPNLCIHLQKAEERSAFSPNFETNLKPILASVVYEQLTGRVKTEEDVKNSSLKSSHYAGLLLDIAAKTGVPVESIVDLELSFSDVVPGCFVGLNKEFVSSPRLDNLMSSWACIRSLSDPVFLNQFIESNNISMINLYDHEECGSVSFQGADSNLLVSVMERIWTLLSESQTVNKDDLHKMYLNSFLISCDVGHSVHPNYEDRHKENHKIKINEGIAIKINPNQRYCTDSISTSLLKVIADEVQVPVQQVVVKNDSPCGSTIGPAVTSKCGIKGIDIGAPTWGMHSIRETAGTIDTYYLVQLMGSFFVNYEKYATHILRC